MSLDHKPNDRIEYERIINAGSTVIDGRINGHLNLSRAIGDFKHKENQSIPPENQAITAFPDIQETIIQPNDEFIILACDGIWDVLSNQD